MTPHGRRFLADIVAMVAFLAICLGLLILF